MEQAKKALKKKQRKTNDQNINTKEKGAINKIQKLSTNEFLKTEHMKDSRISCVLYWRQQ